MLEGQAENRRTRDPTLRTVRLLRLTLKSPAEAAEVIESVELPDRELAMAVGHQLIDRHSHEVYRSIGLGLELLPPAKPLAKKRTGFGSYRVSAKALEQARMLGVSGDIEAMVSRMAKYAAPVTHPMVNRRHDGYAMRVKNKP